MPTLAQSRRAESRLPSFGHGRSRRHHAPAATGGGRRAPDIAERRKQATLLRRKLDEADQRKLCPAPRGHLRRAAQEPVRQLGIVHSRESRERGTIALGPASESRNVVGAIDQPPPARSARTPGVGPATMPWRRGRRPRAQPSGAAAPPRRTVTTDARLLRANRRGGSGRQPATSTSSQSRSSHCTPGHDRRSRPDRSRPSARCSRSCSATRCRAIRLFGRHHDGAGLERRAHRPTAARGRKSLSSECRADQRGRRRRAADRRFDYAQ
jgi:hypothetical protein